MTTPMAYPTGLIHHDIPFNKLHFYCLKTKLRNYATQTTNEFFRIQHCKENYLFIKKGKFSLKTI